MGGAVINRIRRCVCERPFHREVDQAARDLADSLRHYEIRLQAETKEAAGDQAQLGVLT